MEITSNGAPNLHIVDVEHCALCGDPGPYRVDPSAGQDRPVVREHYRCPGCRAQLRYHAQALSILDLYRNIDAATIAELSTHRDFVDVAVYEPGTRGPFRRYLRALPGYVASEYHSDVAPGTNTDGLRSEDLMDLTFDDGTFDLVVTSDVFEHVRHPMAGFTEVHRVLKPGGTHVFTIPLNHPMRDLTVERVDTRGDDDIHLLEPHYHAVDHLVYNDFGADLLGRIAGLGAQVAAVRFPSSHPQAAHLLTFTATKPPLRHTESRS